MDRNLKKTMPKIQEGGEPFFLPGNSVGCLLVHGFVSAPQEMTWLGDQLNKSGFSVLGVRLHGHATKASDLHRIRGHDWIADIEDGYHYLKDQCTQIAMVGMSLGGALALLSSSYLPVNCTIAISTPFETIPYPNLSFLGAGLPLLNILQSLIKSLPKPPPLDFVDRQAAKDHLTYSVFPTRGVIETDKLLLQMRTALSQVTTPVLVIHSLKDRGVPIENADKITSALVASEVENLFLDEGGHVVLLEPDRDKAAKAIIQFINKHTREQG